MNAFSRLAKFPALPRSIAAAREASPSSLGRRRRDDDDDEDDNGNEDGNEQNSRRQRSQRNGHQGSIPRVPSSLRFESSAHSQASGSGPSRERQVASLAVAPTLEYCTQACLLGLVRGDKLDSKCPNYLLHQQMSRDQAQQGTEEDCHALTQSQFVSLVREQLFATPEVDCICDHGFRGSVGFPFKITLTGTGYTFFGKAVEDHNRRRLVRESEVYAGLQALQGVAVPVYLGLVELIVPYSIPRLMLALPYMQLMSFAGTPIPMEKADEFTDPADIEPVIEAGGVKYRFEWQHTLQELEDAGLWDRDENPHNSLWCSEVGCVMRIDFDHAFLLPSKGGSQASEILEMPSTPKNVSEVSEESGTGDPADKKMAERPRKRSKYVDQPGTESLQIEEQTRM